MCNSPKIRLCIDSARVTALFSYLNFLLHCTTGDLLFTLPKRSDTGLYSCEVVNEHGMDMASTKVVIEGKKIKEYLHGQKLIYK